MIDLIIITVLAFWAGWRASRYLHTQALFHLMQELGIKESDLRKLAAKHGVGLPENSTADSKDGLEEIHIKVEQHGSEIYAFRVDNDQFLGQGQDRESLIDHLRQRMVNVRLIVDEGSDLLQKNNSQIG